MKNPKLNYLITIFIAIFSLNAWSNCPEFETALEAAMKRVGAKEAVKKEAVTAKGWSSKEAQSYKTKYGKESVTDSGNRTFIRLMEADQATLNPQKVMYFDVENAVMKKLNDSLVGDKAMVDAINNSFMEKFHKNLKESPEVMSRLEGEYKDYKSLRLRMTMKTGDDQALLEEKLSAIYQKTNREFTAEFEKNGLTKLLPPRTDEVPDVSTWFLSGTGDSALEANMAARGARRAGFAQGNARPISFKQQIESMHSDVVSIEGIRKSLASDPALLKNGIMIKTEEGVVIPSKEMIGILRKIKPSDCDNAAEYAGKIRAKVRILFNSEISNKHIDELTSAFQKVDSISPPLFQRERVAIHLGEAKGGIISVDFTGVGVDNAFEQMKGLALVNYAQTDKTKLLKEAFGKVQSYVDGVTTNINQAKRTFSLSAANPKESSIVPKFSGDDGILLPEVHWSQSQKTELLKKLGKTEDPSKYRITFVETKYNNGSIVPANERSQRVVRAEEIEKSVREAVIGVGKVSSQRSKKMIFAIDSQPAPRGGQFTLIIGGVKPTYVEKKLIMDAFKRSLAVKEGETSGNLIEAY